MCSPGGVLGSLDFTRWVLTFAVAMNIVIMGVQIVDDKEKLANLITTISVLDRLGEIVTALFGDLNQLLTASASLHTSVLMFAYCVCKRQR